MKEIIQLNDYLRTGKFGSVQLHDKLDQVLEVLGEPDGPMNLRKGLKGIHYSMYEFTFDEDGLQYIQNDHFNLKYPELMEFESERIQIDPGILEADRPKSMLDLESELQNAQIEYREMEYFGRSVFVTVGNVIVDFNDEIWSDQQEEWIKTTDRAERTLIGFRQDRYNTYSKDASA